VAGSRNPAPLGADPTTPILDEGTLARTATPEPGPVGAIAITAASRAGAQVAPPAANDPEIEVLDLRRRARKAAYALKKAHPAVSFTSGRRSKDEQASAMASNVVKNRKWIEQTYAKSSVRHACQRWVDDNPDKTTRAEIAEGLASVLHAATDSELAKLSKHLSGDAFDVQPVDKDAESIKTTIRSLLRPGRDRFLDKEGGLVRWHVQF
jgi:hypothetical protein